MSDTKAGLLLAWIETATLGRVDMTVPTRLVSEVQAEAAAQALADAVDWPVDDFHKVTLQLGWVDGVVETEASGATLADAVKALAAAPASPEGGE